MNVSDSVRWRREALCRGFDQEVFFPDGHKKHREKMERVAKAICAECSVSVACLEEALEAQEAMGIWGGTTPEERGLRMDGRGTVSVLDPVLEVVR